jgi:hypothetical protein
MKRVEFLVYKGKRILLIDFSKLKTAEVLPVIQEAKQLMAKQAKGSVYTLTDLTQTGYNPEVTMAMKDYALYNKPYVKASAVVGTTSLMNVIKNSVEKTSMRSLVSFATREEAQEWLASQ